MRFAALAASFCNLLNFKKKIYPRFYTRGFYTRPHIDTTATEGGTVGWRANGPLG